MEIVSTALSQALKYFHYFMYSSAQSGFFFVMNCIVGLSAPFFHQKLGVSFETINLVICGVYQIVILLLQPLIGMISDYFPLVRFKRRFLLVMGTITLTVALPLIGFCDVIGKAIENVDNDNSSSSVATGCTTIVGAVIGFVFVFIASIGYSFIQSPSRAIIIDITPKEEQNSANFIASMTSGFSAVLFYLIAAIFTISPNYYPSMFLLSTIVIVLTVLITCLFAHEKKSTEIENLETESPVNEQKTEIERTGFSENSKINENIALISSTSPDNTNNNKLTMFGRIKEVLTPKILLLYFLTFLSMTAFGGLGINICNFYSTNLYHASPCDEEYNVGVSMALYGMAIMSFFQMIFSVVLPILKHQNFVFVFSLGLACVSFCGYIIINELQLEETAMDPWMLFFSFLCCAGIGMLGTCLYSIPFILIHKLSQKNHIGIAISILVSFLQLGISFAGVAFTMLLLFFDSLVVVMYFSAVVSFIGAVAAFFILRFINPN
ncbi:hypothetical protein EIN_179120 [Entamoeba invadens IP1]|uniref:hypothetical protein n=1 Tax=Entamoeba invadens IP1 TaxID=370355 RepID=UPI0002C3EBBE|nr:hypothetical protein EIN_179120 [Entamoeba invadens IP1]ELP93925.1 hypothetical protein EIN_179120 [Entamoeba invadens IP1]|eukprot:XP_004260696.1 hypothetical protein EIN_179120 [Entamoeba invadens IP1]